MQEITPITCPLCNDRVDRLLYRFHIESEQEVIDSIKSQNPEWVRNDGICSRCIDYYHTQLILQRNVLPEIGPYFPVKSVDDFVILPTGLRLNSFTNFTGKGVTICFIDSGFYLHPDLIYPENRVKAALDIASDTELITATQSDSWHGTMTSVVCAGNGYLSKGLYKGLASDADLVLLKVADDEGKISDHAIEKALAWINRHHVEFGIRIVNISIGADGVAPFMENRIDLLAEELIGKGITVIAAVGNGDREVIAPPANSLNVISVGGADDNNSLLQGCTIYHSTYGKTVDGFVKPEIIAPAMWVAAPLLPGTTEQKEAASLYQLLTTGNENLAVVLKKSISDTKLDTGLLNADPLLIKQEIIARIQHAKYISPHYMHVDGTSFAAPILASVTAQMLEADQSLPPQAIRTILFGTARRLEGVSAIRQGYGLVQPRRAVLKVLQRKTPGAGTRGEPFRSPLVNRDANTIAFFIENSCAEEISVAGSFNRWAQDVHQMKALENGLWKVELPMLPRGKYHYKFFIDRKQWVEDVINPYREPDGFNGFNSVLLIEN